MTGHQFKTRERLPVDDVIAAKFDPAATPSMFPEPVEPRDEYLAFIQSKARHAIATGFDVPAESINPMLFPFQRAIVRWGLRRGRGAFFEDCGLGKTPQQLDWAAKVSAKADAPVLILCPLAVANQTKREGEKFGVPVTVCRSHADVAGGVNVANYEILDKFDCDRFGGVVLDESSILKSFMGKTKQALCDAFARTPYRLCCTATPAPNDHLELGNHAQFLGVMDSNEMISRWFINDTMNAGGYRLKHHAAKDFWAWVASWAVSVTKPSDLGYADDGFILPSLNIHNHVVDVDAITGAGDALFRDGDLSATTMHKEMKLTAADRARKVAEVVSRDPDEAWLIWCNTNYEADELRALIPGAVEVRGSDKPDAKVTRAEDFAMGRSKILISKPKIFGMGLNFQHCRNVAFVGLSFSYEQFYQAVRRTWRFGQTRPVECHVIAAATEGNVRKAIAEKQAEHAAMQAAMGEAIRELGLDSAGVADRTLKLYDATVTAAVPAWMKSKAS